VPVLSLAGRLDSDGVAAVEALLTEAQGCDRALVPCDLSDLGELTGDAVHRLLEVAAARPACPAPVVLCCVSGQPARMLAEVDPGGALPLYATVAEAVGAPDVDLRWAQLTPTCDLQTPRRARAFVGSVCASWHLEDIVDDVTLLTSELVTNAMLHADGAQHVLLQRCRDHLTIAVVDGVDALPQPRPDDRLGEDGRGLLLVEALACDDGTYPQPGGGKVVWCTVQLSSQN